MQSGTPSGGVAACSPTPDFLTGKPRDAESNLDDFAARYFSSSYGRWMSPDWSSTPEAVPYASLVNPQSLNLYPYVGNDPIDGVDVNGHFVYKNLNGFTNSYSDLDDWEVLQLFNRDAVHPASQPDIKERKRRKIISVSYRPNNRTQMLTQISLRFRVSLRAERAVRKRLLR